MRYIHTSISSRFNKKEILTHAVTLMNREDINTNKSATKRHTAEFRLHDVPRTWPSCGQEARRQPPGLSSHPISSQPCDFPCGPAGVACTFLLENTSNQLSFQQHLFPGLLVSPYLNKIDVSKYWHTHSEREYYAVYEANQKPKNIHSLVAIYNDRKKYSNRKQITDCLGMREQRKTYERPCGHFAEITDTVCFVFLVEPHWFAQADLKLLVLNTLKPQPHK